MVKDLVSVSYMCMGFFPVDMSPVECLVSAEVEGIGAPGIGVTHSCEPPDICAGNGIQSFPTTAHALNCLSYL